MKQTFYILSLLAALMLAACSDDDGMPSGGIAIGQIELTVSGDGDLEGLAVELRNTSTGSIFAETTDSVGRAAFTVTPGIYEATVSGSRSADGYAFTYNGTSGLITVMAGEKQRVVVALKSARSSQVIIKEVYNGGCIKDDGTTKFQFDKGIILYNNSALKARLANLCFGFAAPYNSQANNKNYGADGRLTYEAEGFLPALNGIWYFPDTLEIEPYEQVVVSVFGAIDNTLTVSQSVDYAHSSYYCMYDPESGYDNTNYYPTPSSVIPTSHYLRAVRVGLGNAWALSVTSPALFIFQTRDAAPADYAALAANQWYDGGQVSQAGLSVRVPVEWVVDGMEVFASGYKDSNNKRLTADVDAGYVGLTNYQGHSLYRNVDQAATEALPENAGRLVYGYALAADGSSDPSGIDAEASMRRGAHIIYQDTNNSSNDFHERQQCSLRDQ